MQNRKLKAIWSGFLVLVLVAFGTAQTGRAADRDKVLAFLQVTGFDVALDSIALAAEDAPAMIGLRADSFGYQWTRAADEVFDTARMRGMAVELLEQTLSDDLLAHAASFYASPLGLRLVEVENVAHMVEDDTVKKEQGAALVRAMTSGDRDRLAHIERMNAAIDSAGMGVRAVQEIQLRFLIAAGKAGVIDLDMNESELRSLLRQDEDEMRSRMAASALANAAYTYRDFSTEEIARYADALQDPQMQQVYDLMNAIQWEIMANRFEALAVKLAGMSPGEEL